MFGRIMKELHNNKEPDFKVYVYCGVYMYRL